VPRSDNSSTPPAALTAESFDPDNLKADLKFEKEAERAETEAALERDLEGTFPTSDPSSSWAGADIEPERPTGDEPSKAFSTSPIPGDLAAISERDTDDELLDEFPVPSDGAPSGQTGVAVGKPDPSTE
jgi:hypothetical protein